MLRLAKLIEHYFGEDKEAFSLEGLALRIACDFVPRFDPMPIKAVGRRNSVLSSHMDLTQQIEERCRLNPRLSVLAACLYVTKSQGFRGDEAVKEAKRLEAAIHRFNKEMKQITPLLPLGMPSAKKLRR